MLQTEFNSNTDSEGAFQRLHDDSRMMDGKSIIIEPLENPSVYLYAFQADSFRFISNNHTSPFTMTDTDSDMMTSHLIDFHVYQFTRLHLSELDSISKS